MTATLLHGDCLDALISHRGRPFDVVLTDPPGAKNMAEWDSSRGGRDKWVEWLTARLTSARLVSRSGAWLCCWAHPTTTGWTQRAIEDAGWCVFDRVTHLNAQGRASSSGRLAPGCEDWWLAHAPGAAPNPLRLDLPAVAPTTRWRHPRNVLLGSAAAGDLDTAAGTRKSGSYSGKRSADKHRNTYRAFQGTTAEKPITGDEGSLSRFFPTLPSVYAPKARFSERVLPDGSETKHPTAKSPTLVDWLLTLLDVRLGQLVADPFMGSGVVGEVAVYRGADFWGCDAEQQWVDEARVRMPT